MASVIGKWKIEHCENFEEYMKAIANSKDPSEMPHDAAFHLGLHCLPKYAFGCRVSEEWRDNAHKFLSDGSEMTQEFSADGDNWTITTSTGKGEREFKVTLGQVADSITLDGRPIKVVFSVDGDSLVEKQTGDGFECTHVRTGSGDKLNMKHPKRDRDFNYNHELNQSKTSHRRGTETLLIDIFVLNSIGALYF